jgi:hypothetical protein
MNGKKGGSKEEENSLENESSFKNIWANFPVSIHLQQKRGGDGLNNNLPESIDLIHEMEKHTRSIYNSIMSVHTRRSNLKQFNPVILLFLSYVGKSTLRNSLYTNN